MNTNHTNNTDNIDIRKLLERFFDGDTTCAEDKFLEEYFTGENVPEQLRKYQPMFKWYADGMPDDRIEPIAESHSEKSEVRKSNSKPILKPLIWFTSVAAAVAIAFVTGWNYHTDNVNRDILAKQHEGSYMLIDGVIYTDTEDIYDEIEKLNREAELIEFELNSIVQENPFTEDMIS